MAKFEKTLSGDFETIAYNIENYLINDESIRLVDKVSMKNGSTNCSTMVFDIYIDILPRLLAEGVGGGVCQPLYTKKNLYCQRMNLTLSNI